MKELKKRPPGFLRPSLNPDVVMMICTAGHVDHGKTQLVKLLTGCNTDRLKAEQERGLTIELGFAPCFLGGNLCVGIVDVPGHEKFVKNMVAGVSGIEMAILVIAADDGIMPQTVEHVQIMELLGVRRGIVALTKIDLVSPEAVRPRVEEIREFLRGSFLDGALICPVSSETFEGYEEFYGALVERVKNAARTRAPGIFRMPIERVFTRPGFGAVATGIPVAGTIEVGAQVEIVPGGQTGKIRGIQRFLRDANEGGRGQCLALNIPDLGKNPPVRGQVVCLPGHLKSAQYFQVQMKAVSGLKGPLRNAEAIKFHTGTIEAAGKIFLLEDKVLDEGRTGLATVALNEPVAAAAHDRFILRRPSPAATVAGGDILAVSAAERRPRNAEALARLRAHLALFEGVDPSSGPGMDKRVESFLLWERKTGAAVAEISRGTLLPAETVKDCLGRLAEEGRAVALSDDYYVHSNSYRAYLEDIESRLRRAGREEKALSLSVGDLRKEFDCPPILWSRIEEEIERRSLARKRGDRLILPEALDHLGDADRQLMAQLLQVYEETGFHSPRPDELPDKLGASPARIAPLLKHLCSEEQLIRLAKNVILHHAHFKRAQDLVVSIIREKGSLDSGEFKDCIRSSRKYALAILDYLDARRVTVRNENERKLTADYHKRLV